MYSFFEKSIIDELLWTLGFCSMGNPSNNSIDLNFKPRFSIATNTYYKTENSI